MYNIEKYMKKQYQKIIRHLDISINSTKDFIQNINEYKPQHDAHMMFGCKKPIPIDYLKINYKYNQ